MREKRQSKNWSRWNELRPLGQSLYAMAVLVIMAVLLIPTQEQWHWIPSPTPRPWAHEVVAWSELLKPGAGYEVALPPNARDGIELIRAHDLKRFALGSYIHSLDRHRTIEGAFPALYDRRSRDIVDYVAEVDTAACQIIATRGKMAYARCHGS